MKVLTKAQLIEQHEQELARVHSSQYHKGFALGVEDAERKLKHEREAAKLQQLQAAAKLMEEITRAASRIGYMIGKINGDNAR